MATIDIPDEYMDRFEERSAEKGFESADEYIEYVLGQVYEKLGEAGDRAEYTDDEEEKVKDRLRGLGYLD